MSSKTGVLLAYATFPDGETAERLCKTLVTEDLIRCANILAPHVSIYRFQERDHREVEVAAILKFAETKRELLARRFCELHPYDVPALVYLEVTGGAVPFLDWIRQSSP